MKEYSDGIALHTRESTVCEPFSGSWVLSNGRLELVELDRSKEVADSGMLNQKVDITDR